MKRGIFILTGMLLLLTSCVTQEKYREILSKKIPPEKQRADVLILRKILEANHPSLYWYTPKDSMNLYFSAVISSLQDSLTEPQFKAKIAWLISKIRCGHTAVRSSEKYLNAAESIHLPQFPLYLKAWKDSLVVLGSVLYKDTIFKRGTVITSINHIGNRELLDSMFQFISTDGYADNFKDQAVSFNFPAYYRMAFGSHHSYTIGYLDDAGSPKTVVIPEYDPAKDTLNNFSKHHKPVNDIPPLSKKERRKAKLTNERSFTTDTLTGTAYMQLATFSGGRLRNFFRQSFRTLKKNQTANLIIDLRENGGGSISMCTLLSKYLSDHPFHTADTIAAISRNFPYGRYIHPSLLYWMAMHLMSRKEKDGRYHLHRYEKHYFSPKKQLHYNGNIYLLQGGYSFSAAVMLLSNLKDQPNVTTVGEETGGGSYGNSSVHLPFIILPNSGVQVVLPMYRVVFDHTRPKNGEGFFPDIAVNPSALAIKNHIDLKIEIVKALIAKKSGIGKILK